MSATGLPALQGYLTKEGKINSSSLKKRYFQLWLQPPHFSYYETKGGKHLNTVLIEGADNHVSLNPSQPNAFYLITGNRKWSLRAESGLEMSSWVSQLTKACEYARRAQFTDNTNSPGARRVLVAGARSSACAAAVSSLLQHTDINVRAYVELNRKLAPCLGDRTVELVHMDCDDPQNLNEAMAGVDTLIVEFPTDRTLEVALAYMEAAMEARVGMFVVLWPPASSLTATVFSQYRQIERDLKSEDIPFCMVMTNHIMDECLSQTTAIKTEGKLYAPPISLDEKYSFISSHDVGNFLATIATDPTKHVNTKYNLTGSTAVSYREAAALVSTAVGKEITAVSLSEDAFLKDLMDNKNMTRWTAEGYLELFTQGQRYIQFLEREKDSKRRRKFTRYDCAETKSNYESLCGQKRVSIEEFIELFATNVIKGGSTETPASLTDVFPLLSNTDASLLQMAPNPSFLSESGDIDLTGSESKSENRQSSMDTPRISIPAATENNEGKTKYTAYNIKLRHHEKFIPKRFSQIREFHKEICRRYPDLQLPAIPSRSLIVSANTIESRRIGFQKFLEALVAQEKVWPELSGFLGVDVRAALGSRMTSIRTIRSNSTAQLGSPLPKV